MRAADARRREQRIPTDAGHVQVSRRVSVPPNLQPAVKNELWVGGELTLDQVHSSHPSLKVPRLESDVSGMWGWKATVGSIDAASLG